MLLFIMTLILNDVFHSYWLGLYDQTAHYFFLFYLCDFLKVCEAEEEIQELQNKD